MVVTNTSNSMKYKIKFFLLRSPKVMRAGTGNKKFILYGLTTNLFRKLGYSSDPEKHIRMISKNILHTSPFLALRLHVFLYINCFRFYRFKASQQRRANIQTCYYLVLRESRVCQEVIQEMCCELI